MIHIVRSEERKAQVAIHSSADERTVIRGQAPVAKKKTTIRGALSSLAERIKPKSSRQLAQVDSPPIENEVVDDYPATNYEAVVPPLETYGANSPQDNALPNGLPRATPGATVGVPASPDSSKIDYMVNGRPGTVSRTEEQMIRTARNATVRIRIKDQTGVSLGSGTIVDVHGEEALVLTCGHIFHNSQGRGEILCDLFAPNSPSGVPGKLISYNAKRDIGLISIRPGVEVSAVRIGGAGCSPQKREAAFSLGCNRGSEPTVIRDRVLDINRYLGPANIVVGGRPVEGRSGGGLFNSEGMLIGVCNAADPKADEGLYAALGPVHAELDSAGLSFIYRSKQALARADDRRSNTPPLRTSSAHLNAAGAISHENDGASNSTTITPSRFASQSTPMQPSSDAEVICIVRPRGGGEGQAYVLDDPSDSLMNELTRELSRRSPHQNTGLRTQPRTTRKPNANRDTNPNTYDNDWR